METRQQFIEGVKKQLDEWNAEIDKLEQQAQQQSAEAQRRYDEKIAELRQLRDRGEAELRRRREESETEWDERRNEAERAFNDIAEGFRSAWKRFH